MKKPRKIRGYTLHSFFIRYGFHVFFLFVLVNLVTSYVIHYYIIATGCMTRNQVASDARCLYIWGQQIYHMGSIGSHHQGHPCGTDVTAIIPPTHVGNQAHYLLPNYIANLCPVNTPTSTPVPPTSTPTPKPTSTPIPNSPTKQPTATSRPQATNSPVPQNTSTPSPTIIHINTPTPTAVNHVTIVVTQTITQTVTHTTLTPMPTDTNRPTPSPTPTQAATSAPILNFLQEKPSPTGTQNNQSPSPGTMLVVSKPIPPSNTTIVSPMMRVTSASKILVALCFLLFCSVLITGILRRKKVMKAKRGQAISPETISPSPTNPVVPNSQEASSKSPLEIKEIFFLKATSVDAAHSATWVLLTQDNKQIYGYYHGLSPKEGLAKVIGVEKVINGQTYIDIINTTPVV